MHQVSVSQVLLVDPASLVREGRKVRKGNPECRYLDPLDGADPPAYRVPLAHPDPPARPPLPIIASAAHLVFPVCKESVATQESLARKVKRVTRASTVSPTLMVCLDLSVPQVPPVSQVFLEYQEVKVTEAILEGQDFQALLALLDLPDRLDTLERKVTLAMRSPCLV